MNNSLPANQQELIDLDTTPIDDYIEIDTVPVDEYCVQLGSPFYTEVSPIECRILTSQIKAEFPLANGLTFKMASNPHDFGTYYTLRIKFKNAQSQDLAYMIEESMSNEWSKESKKQLNKLLPAAYKAFLATEQGADWVK